MIADWWTNCLLYKQLLYPIWQWHVRNVLFHLSQLWAVAMWFFNFLICSRTRFCPGPSWHHLLCGIRFYCCVLFIRYWKFESRCPQFWFQHIPAISFHRVFMAYCCFYRQFTNAKWRVREFVRYVSQQRGRTTFPLLRFPYQLLFMMIPKNTYSCV